MDRYYSSFVASALESASASVNQITGMKYASLPQQHDKPNNDDGYSKLDSYDDPDKEWESANERNIMGESEDDEADRRRWASDCRKSLSWDSNNSNSKGGWMSPAGAPLDRIMNFFGKARTQERRVEPIRGCR